MTAHLESVKPAADTVFRRMTSSGVVGMVTEDGGWIEELSGDGEMGPRHGFYPGTEEGRRVKETP